MYKTLNFEERFVERSKNGWGAFLWVSSLWHDLGKKECKYEASMDIKNIIIFLSKNLFYF